MNKLLKKSDWLNEDIDDQQIINFGVNSYLIKTICEGSQWEQLIYDVDKGHKSRLKRKSNPFFHKFYAPIINYKSLFLNHICLIARRDCDGKLLQSSTNYRLTIPYPVPTKLSWSLIVCPTENYDKAIINASRHAIRSSNNKLIYNTDGSLDIYIGVDAPQSYHWQWVDTRNYSGCFFVLFKIYVPTEEAFNGTWLLSNIECIKPI